MNIMYKKIDSEEQFWKVHKHWEGKKANAKEVFLLLEGGGHQKLSITRIADFPLKLIRESISKGLLLEIKQAV